MSRLLPARTAVLLALGISLLSLALLLGACQPKPTPVPTAVPTATPVPRPTADVAAIQAAWQGSAHNNKYDLGKGPNTYCSRCHSPQNWDIAAKVSTPPNCVSCKFPTDKEVRIAKDNRLLAETEWKPIGCAVCHPVENGVVSAKLAIWNNATQKSEPVADSTQLCEKCHTDSIGGSMHKMVLGGGAHSNQIGQPAMRPEQCTDCHNPHTLKADCNACHGAKLKEKQIAGHDAAHAKVKCVACHDATGAQAGPVPNQDYWMTARMVSSGGRPSLSYFTSHNFKKAVTCTRCHFDNNPNKLRSLVTPTAVPAAPAATPTPAK